jgi:hypothetical protein
MPDSVLYTAGQCGVCCRTLYCILPDNVLYPAGHCAVYCRTLCCILPDSVLYTAGQCAVYCLTVYGYYFYCCTVRFENSLITTHQQMHCYILY